jgi:ABC-2 type transport system permease protein
MVVLAIGYRLSGDAATDDEAITWTMGMLEYLGLVTVMPLIALIFGTGAIGGELEDGTAVHLLTKPVPRWQVGLAKFVVSALCAAILSALPIAVAGLIGSGDASAPIAAAAGAAVYVAIFMALSLVTSRAFVIGLGYVLIWEGLLAGLFPGIAALSVRQYSIAFAQSITDALSPVLSGLEPRVELGSAIISAVVVLAAALAIALRRLSRLQIAGETA